MIRLAQKADSEDVYRLICALEQTALPRKMFDQLFAAQTQRDLALVWDEGGKVTGFVHVRMELQLHHCARIAEIMELVVAEEVRGRGIGRALFECACVRSAQAGCVQIELSCHCARHDAHRFYEREGMMLSHRRYVMPL